MNGKNLPKRGGKMSENKCTKCGKVLKKKDYPLQKECLECYTERKVLDYEERRRSENNEKCVKCSKEVESPLQSKCFRCFIEASFTDGYNGDEFNKGLDDYFKGYDTGYGGFIKCETEAKYYIEDIDKENCD